MAAGGSFDDAFDDDDDGDRKSHTSGDLHADDDDDGDDDDDVRWRKIMHVAPFFALQGIAGQHQTLAPHAMEVRIWVRISAGCVNVCVSLLLRCSQGKIEPEYKPI